MGKRAIYSCITLQKELENTIKKIGFRQDASRFFPTESANR